MGQRYSAPAGGRQIATRQWLEQWPDLLLGLLLFILVAGVYLVDRTVVQRSDSLWTLHIALSVVREGDVDLDEYASVLGPTDYRVFQVNGSLVSFFPLGTPLLIAPALLVLEPGLAWLRDVDLYQDVLLDPDPFAGLATDLEMALACMIVAVAVPVVYASGRMQLDRTRAALLTLVFAFCTSAWSTASRALWQHGPSLLMLAVTLYIVLRARRTARWIQWAGLPLAVAYVCRPTNAIPVILFSLYVFLRYRRYFVRYCLWAGTIAILFVSLNLAVYGALLPPYYQPERIGSHSQFWVGLAGNLVSPGRGLLIYSPIFLLSGYGFVRRVREQAVDGLDLVVVGVLLWHWLTIAAFPHWWGGAAYGPRFFTDVTPLLIYLLIPTVAGVGRRGQILLTTVFCVLVVVSGWMHYRGATQWATWQWNEPIPGVVAGVDEEPTRVWDWSDPPFLRGL